MRVENCTRNKHVVSVVLGEIQIGTIQDLKLFGNIYVNVLFFAKVGQYDMTGISDGLTPVFAKNLIEWDGSEDYEVLRGALNINEINTDEINGFR